MSEQLRGLVQERHLRRLDAKAGLLMFIISGASTFLSLLVAIGVFDKLIHVTILTIIFIILLAVNIPYRLALIADSIESRICTIQFFYYLMITITFYGYLLLIVFVIWLFPIISPFFSGFLVIGLAIILLFGYSKQVGHNIWYELAPEYPNASLAASYLTIEAFPGSICVGSLLVSVPIILIFGISVGVVNIITSVIFAVVYILLRRRRVEIAERYLSNPQTFRKSA